MKVKDTHKHTQTYTQHSGNTIKHNWLQVRNKFGFELPGKHKPKDNLVA